MPERRDLIFRVFVSSTFSDLVEERNALQETTFKELRKYCQERGARFQAIDLRWGVSAEAGLDHQTMAICRQELARCQELSPRPNFIVLLGDRYGWRPLPARIEATEFDSLLNEVPDADKPLLTTDAPVAAWRDGKRVNRIGWYRKDANAEPAEYVLQPRTIDYPNDASDDDRKRIRHEENQDWAAMEARMREILLGAIDSLGWPDSDPRRFKYQASATHQEIEAGAMAADDPGSHVFCYFREIDGLPGDPSAGHYCDIDAKSGSVDLDAQARLQGLKKALGGDGRQKGLLPPEHVHRYRAWWRNGRPEYDGRELCSDVERDLKAVIDSEIAAFKQKPAMEREKDAHAEFAAERRRHFVGRQDPLQRIRVYASSEDNRPLVIHGKSGSGKTALMAQAVRLLGPGKQSPETIVRFIGATPASCDLRTLLGSLCAEMGVAEVPQDMNELVRLFRAQLSAEPAGATDEAAKAQPPRQDKVILFLDALDQLNPTDNARMLYWMPRELRPNVKIVVSVLQTEGGDEKQARTEDPFDLAKRIWPQSLVEVGALDPSSGAELLKAWLEEAGRTLQKVQKDEVLAKFAKCPLPLYLRLASRESLRWKSWEDVPVPLGQTAEAVLYQLFARLELPQNHGRVLVEQAMKYLATARNGLTEDEMLDVLSCDKTVVADFARRSPESPAADRLPVIVWSRLFTDLRPYMASRRADGTVVMDFYHRQVGEAVRRRYLATDDAQAQAHLHLAEYFDGLVFWAESLEAQRARAKRLPPTPRPANVRKVVELPYHRLETAKLLGKDDPKSPHWDAVADLLTNWQFLEAKAEADPNFREQESIEPLPKTEELKP